MLPRLFPILFGAVPVVVRDDPSPHPVPIPSSCIPGRSQPLTAPAAPLEHQGLVTAFCHAPGINSLSMCYY